MVSNFTPKYMNQLITFTLGCKGRAAGLDHVVILVIGTPKFPSLFSDCVNQLKKSIPNVECKVSCIIPQRNCQGHSTLSSQHV